MTVDGTWKLTVNTPMGAQESTLTLNASGAQLTGTQSAPSGDSSPIADGKVNGNNVAWKASITKPMPLTLEFSGTVNGNQMSGEVKLGMFGSSTFSGMRA
jgi:autotransporter translocation and assembly factor TamB